MGKDFNGKPYHVKLTPTRGSGDSFYSYCFGADEPLREEVGKKFSHAVETYQRVMKENPTALTVSIQVMSIDKMIEKVYPLSFVDSETFTVEKWGTYKIQKAVEKNHFDMFLIEQMMYGHIHLALERKDEKAFYLFTDLLKQSNYKTYLKK